MKQFIVLDHFLNRKEVVQTNIVPEVFDCIVPQKTTFDFIKNINISEEDICLIRDNETLKVEYLGIVDTVERTTITRVAVLPFISIFDNELDISAFDGKQTVQAWITEQINKNFVNTDDIYNKYSIIIHDYTQSEVNYKELKDTDNLLDVMNVLFLNTGIYVDFDLKYENGKVIAINCNIFNANEQNVKKIKYDNPQIIDNIDYRYSQYGNYSKASIKVGDKIFYFYLRQDNKLTTNPEDELRIKKIKNKNVELTASYSNEDELAEALVLLAQTTLCGDAFSYSIEFKIVRSAIRDWKFRQRCDFYAEDKLYQSYITNIQYLNDNEALVTLGAYRYTLTDKFKQLAKDYNTIGNTFDGIEISTALGDTTYWFTQKDGNLYLNYPIGETQPNYSIVDGELIYTYEKDKPEFLIDKDGELVYTY